MNIQKIKELSYPLRLKIKRSWKKIIDRNFQQASSSYAFQSYGDSLSHTFFGYYDISPFSHQGDLLLATKVKLPLSTPTQNNPMTIGYYNLGDPQAGFIPVGASTTWCWQQGCRLQWHPKDPSRLIIFNTIIQNNYGCLIKDIYTKETVAVYDKPLYALSPDGLSAISLNFSRLQRLRPGYGYSNIIDSTQNDLIPKNDGLWLLNLESNQSKLILSLKDIVNINPLESMENATHYLNHIQFNPSGNRFLFFHLWINNNKRFIRLITCDRDGKNPFALINEGHVSHYNWLDNKHIIAYATHQNIGTHYFLYEDQCNLREIIGPLSLTKDGHPSCSPINSTLLLTDTYPDHLRDQHLILFDFKKNKFEEIGYFYSPPSFKGEFRCDLHPRFNHTGDKICIDSSCEGNRKMYVIDLTKREERGLN